MAGEDTRIFVLWDEGIRDQVGMTLESLRDRPPEGYDLFVPGLDGEAAGTEGFLERHEEDIALAQRVLTIVDHPSMKLGYRMGYLLGRGLTMTLAHAQEELPRWWAMPPVSAGEIHQLRGVSDLSELVTSTHEGGWLRTDAAASIPTGRSTLVLCPTSGAGEAVRREVSILCPRWRMPPEGKWNLSEVSNLLDGVERVVWIIAAHGGGSRARDGGENAAAGVVAGIAQAGGRELIVLHAATLYDPAEREHEADSFTSLRDLRARLETLNKPIPETPQVSVGEPLELYREHLRANHDRLVTVFQNQGADTLADVFVELGVAELAPPPPGTASNELRETRAGRVRSLKDLVNLRSPNAPAGTSGSRWVILGEPGAGKTTLARHLTWELANDPDGPLPLYLPMHRWAAEERDPFELAEAELRGSHGEEASGLAEVLRGMAQQDGSLWLLLDGLDELDQHHVDTMLERVITMGARFPGLHISILSRDSGYRDPRGDFRCARIQPLDEPRRGALLFAWLGPALGQRAWGALRERQGLLELTTNPLLLTLMALVWREGEQIRQEAMAGGRPAGEFALPGGRLELFDQAIDLLLRRGYSQIPRGVTDPGAARYVLRSMSLALQEGDAESWTREGLEELLWGLRRADDDLNFRIRETWRSNTAFLEDIATRAGIIGALDGPREPWRFLHRSLREFLAAESLKQLSARELRQRAEAQVELPEQDWEDGWQRLDQRVDEVQQNMGRWAETWALTCAMRTNPRRLLEELADTSTALALRALPSVERLPANDALELLWGRLRGEWDGSHLQALVRNRHAQGESVEFWLEQLQQRLGPERTTAELAYIHTAMEELLKERPDRGEFFRACGRWPDAGPLPLPSVAIPAGSFLMGDNDGSGEAAGAPQHRVTLSTFELGATPVTNRQYSSFDKEHAGDAAKSLPDHPVVGISWWEAYLFCCWQGGRLPTEAEWEYAARAGTTTRYWSGDTEEDLAQVGWYWKNSGRLLRPVRAKAENPWGLYDIHGNVWEWCADWEGPYPLQPVVDPVGPPSGTHRVARGGSFGSAAEWAHSSYREGWTPRDRIVYQGMRVAFSDTARSDEGHTGDTGSVQTNELSAR